MNLSSTITGLPYVGKTTVFNLLTGAHASTGAFAGAEAETNIGVAKVPDERVDRLSALFKPKKTTLAEITYRDLGLAKSATVGEGISAKKLGDLRVAQHTSESSVLAALSFPRLEFVNLRLVRFDEFRFVYAEIFVQHFAQFLRENDRDGASVLRVDRNLKRTGVAIVTVNCAVSFPNAVSVTRGMIVVADEKNFGPEVFVEGVLGFDGGQIIAGGNDAAVQDNQVAIPG